jgi:hypothetical protein
LLDRLLVGTGDDEPGVDELDADKLGADELGADEPGTDELGADEPPAAAASGSDPPLEHPATTRAAAARAKNLRIAPPFTSDAAMLTG